VADHNDCAVACSLLTWNEGFSLQYEATMEEKVFLEKKDKPTEKTLAVSLGKAFGFHMKLLEITSQFHKDWVYTKSGGWMLKIHDRKKALLYVIPLKRQLKVSMTLREGERAALLVDEELSGLHDNMVNAKKFVEGLALHFLVDNSSDYRLFEKFIFKVITLRS
jgi:hypothetical protein